MLSGLLTTALLLEIAIAQAVHAGVLSLASEPDSPPLAAQSPPLAVVGAIGPSARAVPPLALRTRVASRQEMIVTANPLATRAGAAILAAGGNAIDAAIAAEAVLGLTEPQATGIGGGGFLVYYDAASRTVTTFDAREAAPDRAGGR